VGLCIHIQSRADDDAGNGMMAMVMMVRMVVLVMKIIVPEAHRQADSDCHHSCQTFGKLTDFHHTKVL